MLDLENRIIRFFRSNGNGSILRSARAKYAELMSELKCENEGIYRSKDDRLFRDE